MRKRVELTYWRSALHSGYCGSPRLGIVVCITRLLLHLSVALPQIKDLDHRGRVNLVNCIARSATSFTIKVVTLQEYRVIGQAVEVDIAFTSEIKLNTCSRGK